MAFLPGAPAALKKLQSAGFKLFIVSNQSGVGRGFFTMADVELVNQHLLKEFARDAVHFEYFTGPAAAPPAALADDRPFRVRLAQSGGEFHDPGFIRDTEENA